jgi:apolipoprotein N-acyltransferase
MENLYLLGVLVAMIVLIVLGVRVANQMVVTIVLTKIQIVLNVMLYLLLVHKEHKELKVHQVAELVQVQQEHKELKAHQVQGQVQQELKEQQERKELQEQQVAQERKEQQELE